MDDGNAAVVNDGTNQPSQTPPTHTLVYTSEIIWLSRQQIEQYENESETRHIMRSATKRRCSESGQMLYRCMIEVRVRSNSTG